ncbi:MAG TPA: hypothetical protein VFT59_01240, partial [Candidatus Saccharimonadales bacterium]|nr:hypothetical protein [Candidatus Saccharimonadales bacterium]
LLDWRIYHYHMEFFGELSPHTRLSAKMQTPYGAVELKLRCVWNVPLSRFSEGYPELADISRTRNYCRRFTVVLPGKPPELLIERTRDYFDGPGSAVEPRKNAVIVFCDRKWIMSARQVVNRYGDRQDRNLAALADFMRRRLHNAYGPLFN